MIQKIYFSINILVAAFVVGSTFLIWFGLNPNKLTYREYVIHQQRLIKQLNTKLPLLGIVAAALTILTAFLNKNDVETLSLIIVSIVFLIISGLITKFFNQKINTIVMAWSPDKPTPEWEELRSTWWKFHILRLLSGIIGLGLLVFALLDR